MDGVLHVLAVQVRGRPRVLTCAGRGIVLYCYYNQTVRPPSSTTPHTTITPAFPLTGLIPRARPLLRPARLRERVGAPDEGRQRVGQQLVALVAPGGADVVGRGREGRLAGDACGGAGLLALRGLWGGWVLVLGRGVCGR